jgi:nucleotide-binding universal stress UspA family protein
MDKVDQFESVFRSATKAVYHLAPPRVDSVLLITDLDAAGAERFAYQIQQFLGVLEGATWNRVTGDQFSTVAELLGVVEQHQPDLIVSYRHLHSDAWRYPFGLGDYTVVLAQAAGSPLLLLPHPDAGGALEHAQHDTDVVMAITDHLTGDDQLVNWSVRMTAPDGVLHLSHVESARQFERLMATIAKIPSLDTAQAREAILAQLLKEPEDYIGSCRAVLEAANLPLQVASVVRLGRPLEEYRQLIEEREVDLLVMNGKDEDQAAMHGVAHPLAVELRSIPLLLL